MELRQLRYYVGVSEAGSLLKASTRLHIAQPALGAQISALEDEVGARLLERSSRGVTLTEAGKTFLEHAKVVLADVERARQAVRDTSAVPRGDVVIGFPTTVALAATVPVVRACRERLPQVRLKVIEAYSGFLREWLQSGRLDFALQFGEAAETGLAKQALLEEGLALVTSARGPRTPKRIALRALARYPLILPGSEHGLRRIIDDACAPLGLKLEVVAEIDSLTSVKRSVEAGLASTILPLGSIAEETDQGRLRASIIDSPSMLRRVVCATNVTRPATAAGAAVMALMRDVIRERVAEGTWPARWIAGPAERVARATNG